MQQSYLHRRLNLFSKEFDLRLTMAECESELAADHVISASTQRGLRRASHFPLDHDLLTAEVANLFNTELAWLSERVDESISVATMVLVDAQQDDTWPSDEVKQIYATRYHWGKQRELPAELRYYQTVRLGIARLRHSYQHVLGPRKWPLSIPPLKRRFTLDSPKYFNEQNPLAQ